MTVCVVCVCVSSLTLGYKVHVRHACEWRRGRNSVAFSTHHHICRTYLRYLAGSWISSFYNREEGGGEEGGRGGEDSQSGPDMKLGGTWGRHPLSKYASFLPPSFIILLSLQKHPSTDIYFITEQSPLSYHEEERKARSKDRIKEVRKGERNEGSKKGKRNNEKEEVRLEEGRNNICKEGRKRGVKASCILM